MAKKKNTEVSDLVKDLIRKKIMGLETFEEKKEKIKAEIKLKEMELKKNARK